MQARVDRCANTVEQPIHHLKRGRDRNRPLGNRFTGDRDQRCPLCNRLPVGSGRHGVCQVPEFSSERNVRRCAGGNRRYVETQLLAVATPTEKAGVGQQSIEALVEVRGPGRDVLNLGLC